MGLQQGFLPGHEKEHSLLRIPKRLLEAVLSFGFFIVELNQKNKGTTYYSIRAYGSMYPNDIYLGLKVAPCISTLGPKCTLFQCMYPKP